MNNKQIITLTTTIFSGLTIAGVAIAIAAQIVPNDFAQTLMIAFSSSIFGSALTFFLIRMSNLEK